MYKFSTYALTLVLDSVDFACLNHLVWCYLKLVETYFIIQSMRCTCSLHSNYPCLMDRWYIIMSFSNFTCHGGYHCNHHHALFFLFARTKSMACLYWCYLKLFETDLIIQSTRCTCSLHSNYPCLVDRWYTIMSFSNFTCHDGYHYNHHHALFFLFESSSSTKSMYIKWRVSIGYHELFPIHLLYWPHNLTQADTRNPPTPSSNALAAFDYL